MRRLLLILVLLILPGPEAARASYASLRYHVHGGQYIDEQVTTYEAATNSFPLTRGGRDASQPMAGGEAAAASQGFKYYLLDSNFTVAGIGDAGGTKIDPVDFSVLGGFGGVSRDFDGDGDVDADDLAALAACWSGPATTVTTACAGKDLDHDGHVDGTDYALFQLCMSGSQVPAPANCTGGTPPSGTFTLHGLPADVLPDGHILLYARARHYDPKLGRWLQRDPLGYVDGPNLYEAFGGNPLRFQDAFGTEIIKNIDGLSNDELKARWPDTLETLLASSPKSTNWISVSDRSQARLMKALIAKNAEGFDLYKLGECAVRFSGKDPSRVPWFDLMVTGHDISMRLNQERVHADAKRIQEFCGGVFILTSNAAVTVATGPFLSALGQVVFVGPELGTGVGLVPAATRGPAASEAGDVFITVHRVRPLPRLQPDLYHDLPQATVRGVVDKSWKGLIEGQVHGSGAHMFRTYREAITMAKSGQYERIFLNKSLDTATNGGVESLLRPDITGVLKNGKVNMIEVLSPSQNFGTLQNKITLMEQLLGDMAGPNSGVVIPH